MQDCRLIAPRTLLCHTPVFQRTLSRLVEGHQLCASQTEIRTERPAQRTATERAERNSKTSWRWENCSKNNKKGRSRRPIQIARNCMVAETKGLNRSNKFKYLSWRTGNFWVFTLKWKFQGLTNWPELIFLDFTRKNYHVITNFFPGCCSA